MELGTRILERLDVLGITQSELARRAQIPQSTINSLIKRPSRSSPHLVRIAKELRTTPAYLTWETSDPDSEFTEDPLTAEEREWIELLRSVAPKDRAAALQLVRTIAHSAQSPMLQAHPQDFRPKGKEDKL